MKNPQVTMICANSAKIVLELLPEAAPNTVNSFLWAATRGFLDHHAVERIVPGNWVDMSYTAFGHRECRFLIPNEFALHPELTPLDVVPGTVAMGGYAPHGLAACEFFFPLRDCPEHRGIYPVFGRVTEGMSEIERLGRVETVPVDSLLPGIEINRPVKPQVIERFETETYGRSFPDPVRVAEDWMPPCWTDISDTD